MLRFHNWAHHLSTVTNGKVSLINVLVHFMCDINSLLYAGIVFPIYNLTITETYII